MQNTKCIKAAATQLLETTTNALRELNITLEWNNEKEYLQAMFMISMIGHVIATDFRKDEIIQIFRLYADEMEDENELMKEVKRILKNGKRKD
tara:strand:- start:401 stop:679 length:279 start_codon:yes stop_codon:yes gene_type:complete